MTGRTKISPCFAFYYHYEGPDPSLNISRFTIHCTLEKGAEVYYSGIRVVVMAKKTGYDDRFLKARIQPRLSAGRFRSGAGRLATKIEPQEDKEVIDDHALSKDSLPLYTLIFELVDLSDATWSSAEIRFQAVAETSMAGHVQIPEAHRVLYEYMKRTTVHSPSCVLLLATRYAGLRPRIKRDNPCEIKDYPTRMGPPIHGFRILPPSEKRSLFTQPPLEILYNIFSILARDCDYLENWRKGLASMSLVCRAWWRTALCIVYEDFDSYGPKLNIGRLATTLKGNPIWGRYIKRFSILCFADKGSDAQLRKNALTILKTALNMRTLSVGDISAVLVGEFFEAFCKMTELRNYTQLSMNIPGVYNDDSEKQTYLNAEQLTKCFAQWPKLREAAVYKIGQPFSGDGHEFAPARCVLDQITFECGFLSMAQLRAITASSQDTLHTVALKSIRGISNKELTSWLLDIGSKLKWLTLDSNVFTRSEAEELAIDETIYQMPKLFNLDIAGPVATVLTLLRYEPTTHDDSWRRSININDPMLIDPHAFVVALRTTKWQRVRIVGLRMSGGGFRAGQGGQESGEREGDIFVAAIGMPSGSARSGDLHWDEVPSNISVKISPILNVILLYNRLS